MEEGIQQNYEGNGQKSMEEKYIARNYARKCTRKVAINYVRMYARKRATNKATKYERNVKRK